MQGKKPAESGKDTNKDINKDINKEANKDTKNKAAKDSAAAAKPHRSPNADLDGAPIPPAPVAIGQNAGGCARPAVRGDLRP